ncbi:MAG: precorrin-3B C(17)-methyltransferase [Cocleimonas sp.]|nr:precorrin-3B C(17)-methyltransferase [Cocleimonas sp.]
MSTLYLLSTGPGDRAYLPPIAQQALARSQHLVAYSLYLDLLGYLTENKQRHELPLGKEIERARLALNLAAKGENTALISSGDIGIYAMATLVFELLDNQKERAQNPQWNDITIDVIPGVSAIQALASRVGAPIAHDFCTISLSDLLTPWEVIEKRVHAAGEGGFVIAFYNPVSHKRQWQLEKAKQILLDYRPKTTPVMIGRNLTRKNETIIYTTLENLDIKQVDMLALVMVGNCESKQIKTAQKQWVYTPRGYGKKL